jgi:hypothetical protein
MQCAVAISAFWGVVVFKEITGRPIIILLISVIILLSGAVCLGK